MPSPTGTCDKCGAKGDTAYCSDCNSDVCATCFPEMGVCSICASVDDRSPAEIAAGLSSEDRRALVHFEYHDDLPFPTISRCLAFVDRLCVLGIRVVQGERLDAFGLAVSDECGRAVAEELEAKS